MGEFNHTNIVTKSNRLIKSCYSFSLLEQQLLLFIVSYVNPFSKQMERENRVYIRDFIKTFNKKNKNIYKLIEDAISNKFWERSIKYWCRESNGYEQIRWLSRVKYSKKNGYFDIAFTPEIMPMLYQLSNYFTSYRLENITAFKSIFSHRIYELCICNLNITNKTTCDFNFTINVIKNTLGLEHKYSCYKNFKSKVLEKSKSEINTHSDLEIDFNEIKESRKVVAIQFIVERKQGTDRATYSDNEDGSCHDKNQSGKSHDSTNDDGHFIQGESGTNNDDHPKGDRDGTKKSNPREESHEQINRGLAEIVSDVAEENNALVDDIEYWLGISPKTTIRYIEEYGSNTVREVFNKVNEQLEKKAKIDNIPAYFRRCIGGQELAFSSDEWQELKKRKALEDAKKYIEDYEKNEEEF